MADDDPTAGAPGSATSADDPADPRTDLAPIAVLFDQALAAQGGLDEHYLLAQFHGMIEEAGKAGLLPNATGRPVGESGVAGESAIIRVECWRRMRFAIAVRDVARDRHTTFWLAGGPAYTDIHAARCDWNRLMAPPGPSPLERRVMRLEQRQSVPPSDRAAPLRVAVTAWFQGHLSLPEQRRAAYGLAGEYDRYAKQSAGALRGNHDSVSEIIRDLKAGRPPRRRRHRK
jgi:hypothetical protein